MRVILLILIIGINLTAQAQLREGFDPEEAKSLIALCNSYTFIEIYGSDTLIVPKEYRKVFTSEVIGLDNMFQVYENDEVGIISFRGSTSNTSSWVENMFSAMIPGEGVIKIGGKNSSYKFASDPKAAVHSGYALAVVLLSSNLIEQINNLNTKGIYHIMITGHSQGGALALLSRAYLENLSEREISSKNVFKTYAFANPMCGNEEFANEYEARFSQKNMSYSIINTADAVPNMPMHFEEDGESFGTMRFKDWAYRLENFDFQTVTKYVLKAFEPTLKNYINSSNRFIEKAVASSFVSIIMPDYVDDINYFQIGAMRKLEPFLNPKVSLDSLNMTEEDMEGKFFDFKASISSQHKPYQYYVAILKEYFSLDYKNLDLLYLPEGK